MLQSATLVETTYGEAMASPTVEVTEYTDPICSWAWGTEPKFRRLQWRHGHRLEWRTVMGGLVGDASQARADWDAEKAAGPMSDYWRRSSAYTGQPFPMPMRRMARSTGPAGRAVAAAREQGNDVAARVLRRFREATFIFGETPETPDDFVRAARDVRGLDVDRWLAALNDQRSEAAYRADWAETRRPNDFVRNLVGDDVGIGSVKQTDGHDRYAFPTFVAAGPGGVFTVPGWMPYDAYVNAIESAVPGSTSDPRPDPSAAEAFATWGVLTEQELRFICGAEVVNSLYEIGASAHPDGPLADVIAHPWGNGVVFFSPEEAAARSLPATTPHAARAFADLVQGLDIAYRLVARISQDDWARSTPCAEWNVRALVNHMVGSAHMVSFGMTGRAIGPEFYGNHLGADPIASYAEAIKEIREIYRADPEVLTRTLTLPWADMTGAALSTMFAADHLIHAWDVARTLGRPADFDHDLVARLRRFGDAYVAAHRGPEMFDAETEAPSDATPMDRLAAYVGRQAGTSRSDES